MHSGYLLEHRNIVKCWFVLQDRSLKYYSLFYRDSIEIADILDISETPDFTDLTIREGWEKEYIFAIKVRKGWREKRKGKKVEEKKEYQYVFKAPTKKERFDWIQVLIQRKKCMQSMETLSKEATMPSEKRIKPSKSMPSAKRQRCSIEIPCQTDQSRKRKKVARHCVLSKHWHLGIQMEEKPHNESVEVFWSRYTRSMFSSVMFNYDDSDYKWVLCKKHGIGGIDRLIKDQNLYLPDQLIDQLIKDKNLYLPEPQSLSLGNVIGRRSLIYLYLKKKKTFNIPWWISSFDGVLIAKLLVNIPLELLNVLVLYCKEYPKPIEISTDQLLQIVDTHQLFAFPFQCPYFKELDLSNNGIGCVGVFVIIKAMEINSTLEKLCFQGNEIGDTGALLLAQVLDRNNNILPFLNLKILNLGKNKIKEAGGVSIGNALDTNVNLTKLYLNDNLIGDSAAGAIANALIKNSTLTELNISQNHIEVEGGVAIGKALEKNVTLVHLYLNANLIGDSGATSIAAAMQHNTTLTKLNLSQTGVSSHIIELFNLRARPGPKEGCFCRLWIGT